MNDYYHKKMSFLNKNEKFIQHKIKYTINKCFFIAHTKQKKIEPHKNK